MGGGQRGPHSSPLPAAALFDKKECVSHMSPVMFLMATEEVGLLLRMQKTRRGVGGLRTAPPYLNQLLQELAWTQCHLLGVLVVSQRSPVTS